MKFKKMEALFGSMKKYEKATPPTKKVVQTGTTTRSITFFGGETG
jgi:hypothetical protein